MCGPNIESAIMHLENDAFKINEWLSSNGMKLSENKCLLMIFAEKGSNEITIKIG